MANEIFDDDTNEYELHKADGEKILKSLEKIPYQTSKHLCINTGLSYGTIVDHLDGFTVTVETKGELVGSFWVYYLPGNEPVKLNRKLYHGGDRNFVTFREADPKPAHTSKLQIGDVFTPPPPRPDYDEKKRRNFTSLSNGRMGSTGGKPAEKPADETDEIDEDDSPEEPEAEFSPIKPDALRRLAAINPDMHVIADQLGISVNRLSREVKEQISSRKSYEEGKKEYMRNQQTNEKQTTEVKNVVKPSPEAAPPKLRSKNYQSAKSSPKKSAPLNKIPLSAKLTAEYLEDAGFRGLSTKRIGEEVGASGGYVDTWLYNKKNAGKLAAWKSGKERRAASLADQGKAAAPSVENSEVETAVKTARETPKSQSEISKAGNGETEVVKDEPEPNAAQAAAADEGHPEEPASDETQEVKNQNITIFDVVEPADENSLMVDPRFSNTIDHLGKYGHSRDKFDEIQNKLLGRDRIEVHEIEFLGRPNPPGLPCLLTATFSICRKTSELCCWR